MQSTSTRTSRTSQIVVTPTDDPDTSSEMNESEFNESNLTTVQADWTTMQLSFALAGCYTSDVLAWQGLLQGSWIQLPALAFGAFMSLALLLLFCICCGSPAPLPLLELARGDAAQRPPPRRKVVGGWAVKIVDRCAMFIRCYRAGLTERTLLVMQEGTTLSKRQTWADAREEAAMVANLHTQAVLILESFGNPNAGVLTRFRLLWPAMQPWREVTFFSIYSSKLERAVAWLFRMTLASAFSVTFRQVFFGAFTRQPSHQVCSQRPDNLGEAVPVAVISCCIARVVWMPLRAGCMLQQRCKCLRWVAATQGLMSSSVVVVLFLSNTSNADGIWWLFSFIAILLLDIGIFPFLATLWWVMLATIALTWKWNAFLLLREQLPRSEKHTAPEKVEKDKVASGQARVTINSEPSVHMEEPKSLLGRTSSKEKSKGQVGQVLSVLPGVADEEDAGHEAHRDALSVIQHWKQ